jgi:urease accessory protein UreE
MSVLQRFKSVPVAHDVFRLDLLPAGARTAPLDTITLGWEERVKTRARRRSDGGVEFATALKRATILREDDCFVLPQLVVRVVERHEPVFVIEPLTPSEWGRFAYHLGNSHQSIMLTDTALVCADLPGARQVLEYHRIPYTRAERPFTPLTLNPGHVPLERA